ncbi:hypothetical protein Bca101_030819 [Brassica carinata]
MRLYVNVRFLCQEQLLNAAGFWPLTVGRSGLLEEAYEFAKRHAVGTRCGIWGLLGACAVHRDVKLGQRVANFLVDTASDIGVKGVEKHGHEEKKLYMNERETLTKQRTEVTYSVKIENPSSPEREKIERLVFLLLRRPASFVGAGTLGVRGVLRFSFDSLEDVAVCLIFRCRGGESFVVYVWVRRAHLFLGFWLLEGPLLWSCQVDPSQGGLVSPVSCRSSVFIGLILSGEEVYAMRLYSFSLDPAQASGSCHLQEPFCVLVLLSLMLSSGFILAFPERALKVTGSTSDYV